MTWIGCARQERAAIYDHVARDSVQSQCKSFTKQKQFDQHEKHRERNVGEQGVRETSN